jgi:hypothetical protein
VIPPMSPQATPQAQVPPSSTPQAPATGESAESMEGGPQGLQLQALGLIVAAVGIGGLWIARRSR